MIDYSKISDTELARRICDYYEQINSLMDRVSNYLKLKKHDAAEMNIIRSVYKSLKEQIREEAHDVQLKENENCRRTKEFICYRDGMVEAAAFGFTQPTNSKIDFSFYSCIEEARYKISKYIYIDEWRKIAGYSDAK